jgi:hypothetical protein
MERSKCLAFLLLLCALLSCKKDNELDQQNISVQNLYIKFITASRVDITYELSHLGYTETGVTYYNKAAPLETSQVQALREGSTLKLSLQGLAPNTEYVFKVYYKQNGSPDFDIKDYTVKTLSASLAKYALQVADSTINVDEKGDFTANLVGENLNNLNLSKLSIGLNNITLKLDYPVLIAGGKYKIVARGNINSAASSFYFRGLYNGEEILLQSVPFKMGIDRYWLTYKTTKLQGRDATVFNNELYYFFSQQVNQWDDAQQRFKVVANGSMQDGMSSYAGLQFEDQIFFAATAIVGEEHPYPQAGSFSPASKVWTMYPFKNKRLTGDNPLIVDNHLFIHKDELYLAFSVDQSFGVSAPPPPDNYLYRYNKASKQFQEMTRPEQPIKNLRYISINKQLYLLGLVPVYDQGFELSSTFAIYKVNDQNFETKEIYRGGTVQQPVTYRFKQVTALDQEHPDRRYFKRFPGI